MNKIFHLILSFLLIPIISVANPVTSADSIKGDTINLVSDSMVSVLHFDASLSHIDGTLSKCDKQLTSALPRLDYNKYLPEALKWYRKAAEQGHAKAKQRLKKLGK